jgi:nitrate reductase delta subunit
MKEYRALAALLSYPERDLVDALPELRQMFPALRDFVEDARRTPLVSLQERYVALFDRSRALSLHLFEHVHGESRDRGQAMVDLAQTYATRGFAVAADELPDYLPAFLEFLSVIPGEEAKGMLGETSDILRTLGDRLAERGSPYAAVFAELLRLAGEAGLTKKIAAPARVAEDLAALDKSWMEEPVTFMDGPQPVKFYPKGAVS